MRTLVTLACAAALLIAGCDDADTTPTTQPTPTASNVSLSVFPASVLRSGSDVTVTARVTDGQATNLNGAVVTFSTTAGTLSSNSALTSTTGTASVTLSGGEAARVTASASGASSTIDIPAAAPFTVALSTPSHVYMEGAVFGVDVTPNREVINPPGPAALTINCGFGSTVDVTVDRSYRCVFPSAGEFTVQATGRTANGWTTTESARVTAISRSSPTTSSGPFNVSLTQLRVSGGVGYAEYRFTATATAPMSNIEFDFDSNSDNDNKVSKRPDGNRQTASEHFVYRMTAPSPPDLVNSQFTTTFKVAVTAWPDSGSPVTVTMDVPIPCQLNAGVIGNC